MRCQQLTLRLDPQFAAADERRLNHTIKDVDIFSFQTALVPGPSPYWSILIFSYDPAEPAGPAAAPPRPTAEPRPAEPEPTLTPAQEQLYALLRDWRATRAKADGVPPYLVAHNASLRAIAQQHPAISVADDLARIPQLGRRKIERYGAELLALLADADS